MTVYIRRVDETATCAICHLLATLAVATASKRIGGWNRGRVEQSEVTAVGSFVTRSKVERMTRPLFQYARSERPPMRPALRAYILDACIIGR